MELSTSNIGKSKVWSFFVVEGPGVLCRLCNAEVSQGSALGKKTLRTCGHKWKKNTSKSMTNFKRSVTETEAQSSSTEITKDVWLSKEMKRQRPQIESTG